MPHLAAPTRLLIPAERQRRIEDVIAIDPYRARSQFGSERMSLADIRCPDAGCKAVYRFVGLDRQIIEIANGMAATTGPKISS